MPSGPLGFPRISSLGPLSRETKEDLMDNWSDCRANARDETELSICRGLKEEAIKMIQDQGLVPEVKTLQDINQGFCFHCSELVISEIDKPDVELVSLGGMGWQHFWIRYNGRHFDAESPSGEDGFRELEFFKRQPTINNLREPHVRDDMLK